MIDEQDPRKKRFYHGGPDGLKVGDLILPAKEVGKNNMGDGKKNSRWREDRAYLTKNINDAWCFALRTDNDNARVYEVIPLGELEHDPDFPTKGVSFQCSSARIVGFYEEPPGIREACRNLMRIIAARTL